MVEPEPVPKVAAGGGEGRQLGDALHGSWFRVGVILAGFFSATFGAAYWVKTDLHSYFSERFDRIENVELPQIKTQLGRIDSRLTCLEADTREMWGLLDLLYTPGYKPIRRDFTAARQRAKEACEAARFSAAYRIGDACRLDLVASGPRDKVLDDVGNGKLQFELAKTKNIGPPASLQDALQHFTVECKLSGDESAQLRNQVEGAYSSLRENESLIILGDHYNK